MYPFSTLHLITVAIHQLPLCDFFGNVLVESSISLNSIIIHGHNEEFNLLSAVSLRSMAAFLPSALHQL